MIQVEKEWLVEQEGMSEVNAKIGARGYDEISVMERFIKKCALKQ